MSRKGNFAINNPRVIKNYDVFTFIIDEWKSLSQWEREQKGEGLPFGRAPTPIIPITQITVQTTLFASFASMPLCVLCEKSSSPNSKQILVLFKYRLKTVPLLISFPNVILHLIKISLLRGSWRVCYINIGISFLESTTNFTNWLVLWKPKNKMIPILFPPNLSVFITQIN